MTIGDRTVRPIVQMSLNQRTRGTRRNVSHGRISWLESYPSASHGVFQSVHLSLPGTVNANDCPETTSTPESFQSLLAWTHTYSVWPIRIAPYDVCLCNVGLTT